MKTRTILFALVLLLIGHERAGAVKIDIPASYCQLPPFLNSTVSRKPQILILQDNSGSMAYSAYRQAFQPKKEYYGYFDNAKCYSYSSNIWKEVANAKPDFTCPDPASDQWAGSFLNWLTMRRIDVARKVLVGGKGNPRTGSQVKLVGEDDVYFGFNKTADPTGYSPFSGNMSFEVSDNDNEFTVNLAGLDVSVGGSHTCARNQVSLFCWGRNISGQLGNGTTQDETTPSTLDNTLAPNPVTVSAGYDHTCAITSAGTLKCWGSNSTGQLGTGDTTNRSVPTDVLLPPGMKLPIESVASGNGFTCAIDRKQNLWCWGRNDVGQLGIGSTVSQKTPQFVSTLSGVEEITAGGNHACARTDVGSGLEDLYCWGANDKYQLGCGAIGGACPNPATSPLLLPGANKVDVVSLAAGYGHTCAVVYDDLYCWGANTVGQVGNDSSSDRSTPVRVLTSVASVAAGGFVSSGKYYGHTCAVQTDSDLYCWGENGDGQLGIGSTTDRDTPRYVDDRIVKVDLGAAHSCALYTDGAVRCWGQDSYGQVGNDNKKQDRTSPVTLVAGTVSGSKTYVIQVQTSKSAGEIKGVLHELADSAKLGLMFFNSNSEGGKVARPIGSDGSNIVSFETDLENFAPNTSTPLAEALYTGIRYFRWDAPPFSAYTRSGGTGVNSDPWTDPCSNSFILLITDGEPTNDSNSALNPIKDYDGNGRDHSRDADDEFGLDGTAGTFDDYLDDVALYANYPRGEINGYDKPINDADGTSRTRGHRYDKGIPTYLVYTFGDPKFIKFHARVGMNGAFVDRNGNMKPDLQSEWDQDGDGVPDGFFNAEEGDQIERAIRKAFSAILQRTAAGTSISMVSTNRRGDGSIVQSFFRPVFSANAIELNWLGMLQSLWIDSYGNVREDTDQDGKLDLKKDRIIVYQYDQTNKETIAHAFMDENPTDGKRDRLYPDTAKGDDQNLPLYRIKPIWEGGAELARRSASERRIVTFVDVNGDQIADAGEVNDFDPATTFGGVPLTSFVVNPEHDGDGYGIGATWTTAAEWVIRFIQGYPASAAPGGWGEMFRSREVIDFPYRNGTGITGEWKLGDIMFSTPIIVAEPAERYDLLYRNEAKSYAKFYQKYANRKPVLYAGANDGALHVFNPGRFNAARNEFDVDTVGGRADEFGEEIAAIVPQKALPMLQYIAAKNYDSRCHLSFVDQTPRVTDARVFADDARHPNGWGTLLFAEMRLGCHDEKYSSILVLDITDPDYAFDPATPAHELVLAELSPADIGYTYSMPAVLKLGKIDDSNLASSPDQWYLVAGSGPEDLQNANRSRPAFLHVWDLKELVRGNKIKSWKIPNSAGGIEPNAFTSGIIAVDHDLDFNVDMLYFGTVADHFGSSPKKWGGGLWRVELRDEDDPLQWAFKKIIDGTGRGQPFAETPNVFLDPDAIRSGKYVSWISLGTGRFLSRTAPYDDLTYPCVTGNPSVSGSGTCPTYPHQAVYVLKEKCRLGTETECTSQPTLTNANLDSYLVNASRISVNADHTLRGNPATALNNLPSGHGGTFKGFDSVMQRDTTTKVGWYLNLGDTSSNANNHARISGQTVFHPATRGLFFSTYTPGMSVSNSCTATGNGAVYALHFRTGTANPNNPLLYGSVAKPDGDHSYSNAPTAPAKDPFSVGSTGDPNCAACRETTVSGIPGLPATPTIHKNKLIIQDNNANLLTLDRGTGPTTDRGFILWRLL
jgi:alpha-tubulin suppressor-like RCC1 family protein